MHWYSLEDAKELISKGFVFTRYLATEYHEYEQQTVFIKETALYREEIDIFELLGQKPAEWSEEDKRAVNDAIVSLSEMANGEIPHLLPSMLLEVVERLKSLRPQPQGTYKLIVHNIYEMLKDKDFFDITPSHRVSLLNDIRVRCKNADEQAEILDVPSWKPSEEQMKALEVAFRKDGDDNYRNAINSLYNDLKKL
jgi:hypothetical protein